MLKCKHARLHEIWHALLLCITAFFRHQLDRPIGRRAARRFPAASAQIDRGRSTLAALTPQPGQDGGEGRIAVLAHQQADRQDHLAAAAIQLEPALGPV